MDAVILAAGEGTRLRPLTLTRPKPMLPIAGKPILQWDLEALKKFFKKVIIVVGYKKERIIEHFGKKFKNLKLEYIEQKEQLGTGHAVSLLKDHVSKEFFLMNGDIIISEETIKNFITDFLEFRANMLAVIKVENPSDFGIVKLKGNRIQNIIEKPSFSKENLANSGIYFFNEEIFKAIEKTERSPRGEYEITDAIKILIPEVYVSYCKGRLINISKPWDLLDANEILLKELKLEREKNVKIEKFSVLKGKIHIGKNSVIRSGAYIEGPCWIGENCIIGPNCFIRPATTIMNNCRIGNAVEIKNSIIMNNTNICHLSYVGDSIIGESCNFGAGTKIANLRNDSEEVRVEIKNKIVSSGRRKFGCIMGDNVKTGINVSIMPGRAIYPNSIVEAGSIVRNTIMPTTE